MKMNEILPSGKNNAPRHTSPNKGDFIIFEGIGNCVAGTIISFDGTSIVLEGGVYPVNEGTTEYDKSAGGPYDRGAADSYYGRAMRPHKVMDDPDSPVKGARKIVKLTDPDEIAAYEAGYMENDDKKDYGFDDHLEESSDTADEVVSVLNSFDYYTDDSRTYTNDKTGDKIVRSGANWKHASGKHGYGRDSLGDFLSSKKNISESWYDTKKQEDGSHIVVKINDKRNPYKHKIGDKVSKGEHSSRLYASDGDAYPNESINEAEYHGREVSLGKPMRGDVKKYKVFVKDPKTGNVKKVNFGDKNMEIKRDNPKRRSNFRARHKCKTAKDRTSARYWSCKLWSNTPVSKLVK